MSAGLKNAAGATESLGSKFKSAAGLGAAMQVGMKAVSAAMNTMSAHIGAAVSRYDQLNNFPKIMSNLGISAKDSKAALKELDDGIAGLPTTLDSATQGVTRFVSKNGDIKKSTKYFVAMNNAIVAGGQSTEIQSAAVEQLSQAYSKGKMDMQEWRSVQTAMPAQLNMVAKAMGKTTDELGEGLRTGKISMDDFMDTMVRLSDEGIDGMASFAEQALTATGGIKTAFSVMSTAVTRGMANCIGAIDEALQKNKLPTIAELALKAKDAIDKAFTGVAEAIKKVNFKGIIAGLTPAIGLLKSAAQMIGRLVAGIASFFNQHAKAISSLIPVIVSGALAFNAYKSISGACKKLASFMTMVNRSRAAVLNYKAATEGASLAAAVANGDLTKQEAAYGHLGNKITGAASKFAAFVRANIVSAASALSNAGAQLINAAANSKVGTAAKSAATRILAFAAAHRVAMIAALGFAAPIIALAVYMAKTGASADEVADKITSFADAAASAITAFADKVPQVMPAIVSALTTAINSVVQTLPTLIPVIIGAGVQLFMGLVKAVTQIIGPLVAALPQIVGAIVSAIPVLIPAIIDAGITLFSALIDAIPKVLPVIVAALPQIIEAIVSSLPTLLPAMLGAGVTLFSALVDAIPKVVPVIVEALPQIIEAIVSAIPTLIPAIIEAGVTLFSALIDAIPKVLPVIVAALPQIIKAIVQGLLSLVSELFNTGVQLMKSFLSGMQSFFGTIVANVVSFAKSLPRKIKTGLGSLVGVGMDFIAGLWKGIKEKFDGVIEKVKGLAAKLPGAVKKVLGINSPSKVMMEVGGFFDAGLEKGIVKGTRAVGKAASNLGDSAVESVDLSGIKLQFDKARKWAEQIMYGANMSLPDFALEGVGLDTNYNYSSDITVEVPLTVDGKEFARATATYTQDELGKLEMRSNRKKGIR